MVESGAPPSERTLPRSRRTAERGGGGAHTSPRLSCHHSFIEGIGNNVPTKCQVGRANVFVCAHLSPLAIFCTKLMLLYHVSHIQHLASPSYVVFWLRFFEATGNPTLGAPIRIQLILIYYPSGYFALLCTELASLHDIPKKKKRIRE